MARNPERRAFSREVDKLRKRARRGIERLQKAINQSTNFLQRRELRQQLEGLQRDLANLSARGQNRTYTQRAREAVESLRQTEAVPAQRELKQRTTADFERAFRQAKAGRQTFLGSHGREKVQIFYRVTQRLWEGKPMAERNRAILEGLGVGSMQEAYARIMGRTDVREVLRQLDTSGGEVADTDEMSRAYMEAERTQVQIDTPISVTFLQMIESVKAYGAQEG